MSLSLKKVALVAGIMAGSVGAGNAVMAADLHYSLNSLSPAGVIQLGRKHIEPYCLLWRSSDPRTNADGIMGIGIHNTEPTTVLTTDRRLIVNDMYGVHKEICGMSEAVSTN